MKRCVIISSEPLLVVSFFFSAPMPPSFSSHVAFVFSIEPTLFKPCLCPSSHSGRLRSGLTLCANRGIQHQSPTHPMSFCAGQQPQPHKRRLFFRVRIKVATGALVYFLMGHHSPSAWASGELPATISTKSISHHLSFSISDLRIPVSIANSIMGAM